MKVKRLVESAKPPTRATDGSAGYDLYLSEPCMIVPGQVATMKFGITVEPPDLPGFAYGMPVHWVGLLCLRSSSASVRGLVVLSSALIDSDYRGELKLPVTKVKDMQMDVSFTFEILGVGERVAQIIWTLVSRADVVEAEELSQTARGEGGFGSTGQ